MPDDVSTATPPAGGRRKNTASRRRLTEDEEDLLHPPSRKKETRRSCILDWLESLGVPRRSMRVGYLTERSGVADVYLTNRRIFLEVRGYEGAPKKDDPESEGASPCRTAGKPLSILIDA